MGIIDMRDSRPIFEQISDWYRKLILQGVMVPDEKMPSVRSLAMELSTNPNTVQRAYADLEQKGFIYTVRGRGNFVCGGQA
ncbi:MAG: GntR family transcriptional regulator, partial [bacterium]